MDNPYDKYEEVFKVKSLPFSFDYRVTAQCMFGCKRYGSKPTCPPHIPDLEYYKKALSEYESVVFIGRKYPFDDGDFDFWRNYSTNEIHNLVLQKEMDLFQKGHIYAKAFIGGSCKLCPIESCNPERCNIPARGRATLEGTGLNVYGIMTAIGCQFQEPPETYFWRVGAVFY